MRWDRTKKSALAVSAATFAAFLLLVFISVLLSNPAHSERLTSLALICVSASVAAFAFAYFPRQSADLTISFAGFSARLGGAAAAFVVMFLALQFGVRGTSNLYIELFQDEQFRQSWQPDSRRAPPEFALRLRNYTVLTTPESDVIRLFNLPVFESASLAIRTPNWTIAKIDSEDWFCRISGSRISGWCRELKVALGSIDCIERWRGGGSLAPSTFNGVINHFLQLMGMHYPVKLKLPIGGTVTQRALQTQVQAVRYDDKDFCTAIHPIKVDLEQKMGLPVRINLACSWIGISAGDDAFPELTEEVGGWKKLC